MTIRRKEEPRNERVDIRVTLAEKVMIQLYARECGLSVSEFIVNTCMTEILKREDMEMLYDDTRDRIVNGSWLDDNNCDE